MLKFHFNSTSPRFWNRFDSYRINLETIKKTIVGTMDNDSVNNLLNYYGWKTDKKSIYPKMGTNKL